MKNILILIFVLIPFLNYAKEKTLDDGIIKSVSDFTDIDKKFNNFPKRHIVVGAFGFAYRDISSGDFFDETGLSIGGDLYLNFRKVNGKLNKTRNFVFYLDAFDIGAFIMRFPAIKLEYNVNRQFFEFDTHNHMTFAYFDIHKSLFIAAKYPVSYRNSFNYRYGTNFYMNFYKDHFENENFYLNVQSSGVFDAFAGLSFNRLGVMKLKNSRKKYFITNVYFDIVYSPLVFAYGKEYGPNITNDGFFINTKEYVEKNRFGYRFGIEIESPSVDKWHDNIQYSIEFKRFPYLIKSRNSIHLALRFSFLRKNK